MILVDTSVWIEYLRKDDRAGGLAELLELDLVLLHPWVLGELVLGGLGSQRSAIADLQRLPAAPVVSDEEVLDLILERRLTGKGIGWVDANVLASALVAAADLWTLDTRLARTTRDLGVSSPY